MIVTINESHIICLELGFSCGWGEFWVDPTRRGELEAQLQGQRVIMNCESNMMESPHFLWGMAWLGSWRVDPVRLYPLLDWIRQSNVRVTAWFIDGQYPWHRLRQLRWGIWWVGMLVVVVAWGWQLRSSPIRHPVVQGMSLNWMMGVVSEVDALGGVMVSMSANQAHQIASIILPIGVQRPSFDEQTEWVELNQSWQGGLVHERQPL